jgi:hypothetical protein
MNGLKFCCSSRGAEEGLPIVGSGVILDCAYLSIEIQALPLLAIAILTAFCGESTGETPSIVIVWF